MWYQTGQVGKELIHVGDLSHEHAFINLLYKSALKQDRSVAIKFMMYMAQFCPEYRWISYDLNDPVGSVVLECYTNDLQFYVNNRSLRYKKRKHANVNMDMLVKNIDIDRAMLFGRMVTDFMIRHLMYSLIGNSKEKIIITAHNKCDKRFGKYLDEGYSLQRRSKYRYIELSDDLKEQFGGVAGYFEELPIMPNLDTYYDFNEILVCDNHRVLLKTYLPPKE